VPILKLDPQVRAFLEAPRYAVLATINPDGSPHLTEMWYGVRDGELFFNTTEERFKRRNLDRDARVSLLVSGEKGDRVWRTLAYVRVDGTAGLVATGASALEDIVALSVRYDGRESDVAARRSFGQMHRTTYAITIRHVYAKGLPTAA
jgi:PPOX class probable F420-dependent enzyme